jgi:hypothetical protein
MKKTLLGISLSALTQAVDAATDFVKQLVLRN